MPRRDGTGPLGMGPMTGWGMGRCAGILAAGLGARHFFRRYAGFRWRAGGVPDGPYGGAASSEIDGLREQAERLKQSLDRIEKRLGELEKR